MLGTPGCKPCVHLGRIVSTTLPAAETRIEVFDPRAARIFRRHETDSRVIQVAVVARKLSEIACVGVFPQSCRELRDAPVVIAALQSYRHGLPLLRTVH